jgi:predicted permease
VNLFCVVTLEICLSQGKLNPKKILKGLATNPLVLGCLGGGLLNVTSFPIPTAIGGAMDLLSRMALPIALLCAGAALRVRRLKGDLTPALIAGCIALLVKPAIAGFVALNFGITGQDLVVLVLMMSAPTAASGYILARKMGGDHEAMATIIAFETVAGMITLPLVMYMVGV